ncbi:hypothetical protein OV079_48990 [Nannocystis pusilla]|uniref:Uncharacterized protein n=1 Tax=Nannocystis pusilla TaxID=889268 RepID=A0A9X3F7T4_9BACT|nr:hypothetical protein [Nannocystis pusilla]MCY1013338.1 hypothetical protein [Nannocystis pusilla]
MGGLGGGGLRAAALRFTTAGWLGASVREGSLGAWYMCCPPQLLHSTRFGPSLPGLSATTT